MDKRAFLGIALSILVLMLYQEWVTRYYGTPPLPPEAEKKEPVPAPTATQATPVAPAPDKVVTLPASREAKDIRVETDNYVALFTNQGARLKSFKLKNYRTSVDENSPPFEMVQSAPGVPFPLGIRWQNPAPFEDEGLLYSVEGGELKLT
ncbi:MAG TPA: membrane protein insertase YidC, partial [Candidatus Binatia bacterium]